MMDGFSFNGIHCGTLGCWYRPDAKDRGSEMEDYEISAIEPDHRDGGYYIGARVKPRVFEQDCYFEDISETTLENIYRWLYRGTRGRLVFDHKPYCWYDVVASKRIVITLYDHIDEHGNRLYAGTFTATFTCYEPFGMMFQTSYTAEPGSAALARTGMLPASMMPEAPSIASRSFLIYNPGTEAAHTIIRVAGDVGNGMLIRNLTTGQRCRVVSLQSDSLLPSQVLLLDSARGQTRTELGEHTEMAFPFHDEGYITLAPCTPFVRDQRVNYTSGSNIITSDGGFLPHMAGQFIYLDGWKSIRLVHNENRAVISESMSEGGTAETPVVTMNEIEISGDGLDLTRLEIDYTPRVR